MRDSGRNCRNGRPQALKAAIAAQLSASFQARSSRAARARAGRHAGRAAFTNMVPEIGGEVGNGRWVMGYRQWVMDHRSPAGDSVSGCGKKIGVGATGLEPVTSRM